MQNHFTVRGIPTSLAMDGWWLNCTEDTTSTEEIEGAYHTDYKRKTKPDFPLFKIVLLVLLADFLFWQHGLGISMAIYVFAIFGLATNKVPLKSRVGPTMLLLFGVMPVVEYVQLLSLMFLSVALPTALVWAHQPNARAIQYATAALRLLFAIPTSGLRSLYYMLKSLRRDRGEGRPQAVKLFMQNWAFPLGGSLVFLALLMDANPFISKILSIDIDLLAGFNRISFWFGLGLLIWPMINGIKFDDREFATPTVPIRIPGLGLNAGSVLRALIMFNLLIGVQTSMDFSIFIGGADLPKGISYASYAHRGAYPLLVTAILAGAFAISAQPFMGEHHLLKPLLMLWLAQNAILCVSAGLRLDLYIEAYGLTYLRIRALIWIGMIAAGLSLGAWQVLKAHSNRWLVLRCVSLGIGVLYVCSFVNFAAIIANVNIANQKADATYICNLGPMASRAIEDASEAALLNAHKVWFLEELHQCRPEPAAIDEWRDWGVRKWRTGG